VGLFKLPKAILKYLEHCTKTRLCIQERDLSCLFSASM